MSVLIRAASLLSFFAALVLFIAQPLYAQQISNPLTPSENAEGVSQEQVDALIKTLEDPAQREKLIESLRTISEASDKQAESTEQQSGFKTAATELLETLSDRISGIAAAGDTLLAAVERLPATMVRWTDALHEPGTREQWMTKGMHIAIVLGSGFVAAAFLGWIIRRLRHRGGEQPRQRSLTLRFFRLLGRFVVDMLPVVVFAAITYTLLTMFDVGRDLRLIAIALINASIVSRLVLAVSSFLFAPNAAHLRLWRINDETTLYVHHWVQRLTFISVYGFFALQIGLLMGLDAEVYQILLRVLGLAVLGLLLVLVAQNREEVAGAIAGDSLENTDGGLSPLGSMRRGVARVWHLVAGIYLILVYGIWAIQVRDGAEFVVKATAISLLVVAVALLLMRAVDRLFDRGLSLSNDLRDRFPGLERRLNRYFPVLRKITKILLFAFAALLVADAWGIDALGWLVEGAGRGMLGALANVVMILGVSIFIWEFASGVIERYLARADEQELGRYRSPRTRTLLTVGRNALLVLVTIVATLMVLSELGINIAPLLAGAGVVGLAIGFGAQRLVQDVINGVFILFQDLMSVGDVVKLGDYSGVVEALSIRTVRLRDLSGTVHTVPFSSIEGVSNLTREFSFHVFDIGIAYREDVDSVIELIKSVGAELREDETLKPLILDDLEVFGLDAFGDSAIVIKGRIKTRPIKQWQVGRAFNRLIKLRFDEAGIEIPFPHRTLYFGEDKEGKAPPAYVQLENMMREAAAGAGGEKESTA